MIEVFVSRVAGLLPFGYAFGAGMVTTVSPCGIAMLPAYVHLYLGAKEESFRAQSSLRRAGHALLISGVATATFVGFFGIIGAIVSLGGQLLVAVIPWLAVLIAVTLVLLGIYLLIGGYVYANLPARLASRLSNPSGSSIKGFLVFGIAYAIAALSCTLPVFLAVIGSAVAVESLASGLLQFVSFGLGVGFVIAVVTIGTALFKETINRWLRRLVPVVNRVSGLLLVFAGSYILYYWFTVGDILSGTY